MSTTTIPITSADSMLRKHYAIDAAPLELAYVMLTSGLFRHCELAWHNPNLRYYDSRFIAPRDIFSGDIVTDVTVGTYEDLCATQLCSGPALFSCICALDDDDVERIALTQYGDEKGQAKLSLFIKGSRRGYDEYASTVIAQLKQHYRNMFTINKL